MIRPATTDDQSAILQIFRPILEEGSTYVFAPDTPDEELLTHWMGPGRHPFVFEAEGQVLGSYTVRANLPGRGSHVANASYIVSPAARGRGLGRQLCEHSLQTARDLGFRAMQFNMVVSTNRSAVTLWESLGFRTLTRVPGAFRHPTEGYVDGLVMFRELV